MPSSRPLRLSIALLVVLTWAAPAAAQRAAQGFGVQRLYPSAPGGGWVVMDTLDMHGGLGGAASLTLDYAHAPLRIRSNDGRFAVVDHQLTANYGFAVSYERWRLYLNVDMPLLRVGTSGTAHGVSFTAPDVSLGSSPDTLIDPRIGFDARLAGEAHDAARLGVGAQIYVPSGDRATYDTDDTYRAMARILLAGDVGFFTYAAHLGLHVRPRDERETVGSPRGSELLFGAAGGLRLPAGSAAFIVGPELHGATAFRSFFATDATALEALLTTRLEGRDEDEPQGRIKLGAGAGLDHHFGAAAWRLVLALELFGRSRATPR